MIDLQNHDKLIIWPGAPIISQRFSQLQGNSSKQWLRLGSKIGCRPVVYWRPTGYLYSCGVGQVQCTAGDCGEDLLQVLKSVNRDRCYTQGVKAIYPGMGVMTCCQNRSHESWIPNTTHYYINITGIYLEGKSKPRSERQVNCSRDFISLHTKRTNSIGQLSLTRPHLSVELKVSIWSLLNDRKTVVWLLFNISAHLGSYSRVRWWSISVNLTLNIYEVKC